MSQKQYLLADGAYKYKKTAKKACKQVHRVLAGDPCYGKKIIKQGTEEKAFLEGQRSKLLKILAFILGDFRDHWRILSRAMTCDFSKDSTANV